MYPRAFELVLCLTEFNLCTNKTIFFSGLLTVRVREADTNESTLVCRKTRTDLGSKLRRRSFLKTHPVSVVQIGTVTDLDPETDYTLKITPTFTQHGGETVFEGSPTEVNFRTKECGGFCESQFLHLHGA